MPSAIRLAVGRTFDGIVNAKLAVFVFFVLSGFVLSQRYFSIAREDPEAAIRYLRAASLRRYPRLALPVLASVLFAYLLHREGWMLNRELAQVTGARLWIAAFYHFPADIWDAVRSALWDTFFHFDMASSYNTVLWTLEKEFFGSLFVFAALALIGTARVRWAIYGLATAALVALKLHWLNAFVFGLALCDLTTTSASSLRAPGPATAWLRSSAPLSIAIALLVVWISGTRHLDGWLRWALASTLVAGTLFFEPWQRFLSVRACIALGRISFGLYLLHLPLICSLGGAVYLATVTGVGQFTAAHLTAAVVVGAGLLLSWAFTDFIDQPSVRASKTLSARWL